MPLMLVIDKPAGLPVHPGHGGGETLEDHLDHLRFGLPARPQIVHRLDRDTSGCLALGRHAKALRRLNGLFAERRVTKIYHAWLDAIPADQNGIIDCPIAPIDPLTPWRVIADPEGLRPGAQPAQTRWQVLEKRDSRAPRWSFVPSPGARISCGCIAPMPAGRSVAIRCTGAPRMTRRSCCTPERWWSRSIQTRPDPRRSAAAGAFPGSGTLPKGRKAVLKRRQCSS